MSGGGNESAGGGVGGSAQFSIGRERARAKQFLEKNLPNIMEMVDGDNRLPHGLSAQQILCVNFPLAACRAGATMWRHISDDAFVTILMCIAKIIQDPQMGSASTVAIHHYMASGTPKVQIRFEELVDKNDNMMGFRLWLLVNDPSFKFEDGFAHLMRMANERHNEAMSGKQVRESLPFEKWHHLRNPHDLAGRCWNRYIEHNMPMDRLYQDGQGVTDPDSVINPLAVLGVVNAMNCHVAGVCKDQITLDNYIDRNYVDQFGRGGRFKDFPRPELVFKINSIHFTPEMLTIAPLPHVLAREFNIGCSDADYRKVNEKMRQLRAKQEEMARFMGDEELPEPDERETRVTIDDYMAQEHQMKYERLRQHIINDGRPIVSSDEDKFAQDNEMLAMRGDMKTKTQDLDAKYRGRMTKKDDEGYFREINELRIQSVQKFWDIFRFSDPSRLTPGVRAVRQFWASIESDPRKHFYEMNQTVADLSTFGNMMVKMTRELFLVHLLRSNYQLYFCEKASSDSSAMYLVNEIKPHMLVSAIGGQGKSFVMNIVESVAVPGTVSQADHFTTQSWNTAGQTMCDRTFLMHELTFNLLGGKGQDGKSTPDNPWVKAILSKGTNRVMEFFRTDEGKRELQEVTGRNNAVYIINMNDGVKDPNNAAAQRFIGYPLAKKTRADLDMDGLPFIPASASVNKNHPKYLKAIARSQVMHMYTFLWNKAIEAGILPEIDTSVARLVAKEVFHYLKKKGLPLPTERLLTMFEIYCRSYTIMHGVYAEFFSELGRKHRVDSTGEPKPFNPLMLLDLMKWGYVTQEIAIFCISLLENAWVPHLKLDIAQAIRELAVSDCANLPAGCKKWPPRFQSEADAEKYPFKLFVKERYNPLTTKGPVYGCNFNYISVSGDSLEFIVQRLAQVMPEKFAAADIMSTIEAGKNETIQDYGFEVFGDPLKKDYVLESLKAKPGQKTKIEHTFTVDNDPQHPGKTRLSVAVALVNQNYRETLRTAIKESTHAYQREQKVITAFPARDEDGETYVNVLDAVVLKKKPGHHLYFENQYCISEQDEVLLFNEVDTQEEDRNYFNTWTTQQNPSVDATRNLLKDAEPGWGVYAELRDRHYVIDGDLDDIHAHRLWRKECIPDPEGRKLALPGVAMAKILTIQSENAKKYEKVINNMVLEYPGEEIKRMIEIVRQRKLVEKRKNEKEMTPEEMQAIDFVGYSKVAGSDVQASENVITAGSVMQKIREQRDAHIAAKQANQRERITGNKILETLNSLHASSLVAQGAMPSTTTPMDFTLAAALEAPPSPGWTMEQSAAAKRKGLIDLETEDIGEDSNQSALLSSDGPSRKKQKQAVF